MIYKNICQILSLRLVYLLEIWFVLRFKVALIIPLEANNFLLFRHSQV